LEQCELYWGIGVFGEHRVKELYHYRLLVVTGFFLVQCKLLDDFFEGLGAHSVVFISNMLLASLLPENVVLKTAINQHGLEQVEMVLVVFGLYKFEPKFNLVFF
jgi:hypothetical protein